ncbi:hypothetical protein ACU686_05760 [Yinghuangia aomiensis]
MRSSRSSLPPPPVRPPTETVRRPPSTRSPPLAGASTRRALARSRSTWRRRCARPEPPGRPRRTTLPRSAKTTRRRPAAPSAPVPASQLFPDIPATEAYSAIECDYRVDGLPLRVTVVATRTDNGAFALLLPSLAHTRGVDDSTDAFRTWARTVPQTGKVTAPPDARAAAFVRIPVRDGGDVALMVNDRRHLRRGPRRTHIRAGRHHRRHPQVRPAHLITAGPRTGLAHRTASRIGAVCSYRRREDLHAREAPWPPTSRSPSSPTSPV